MVWGEDDWIVVLMMDVQVVVEWFVFMLQIVDELLKVVDLDKVVSIVGFVEIVVSDFVSGENGILVIFESVCQVVSNVEQMIVDFSKCILDVDQIIIDVKQMMVILNFMFVWVEGFVEKVLIMVDGDGEGLIKEVIFVVQVICKIVVLFESWVDFIVGGLFKFVM